MPENTYAISPSTKRDTAVGLLVNPSGSIGREITKVIWIGRLISCAASRVTSNSSSSKELKNSGVRSSQPICKTMTR